MLAMRLLAPGRGQGRPAGGEQDRHHRMALRRRGPAGASALVAMIYPEPEKGGKGKRSENLRVWPIGVGKGHASNMLSQARAVVPYPDLSKAVLDGNMSFPIF
jgi:hypothetical protein